MPESHDYRHLSVVLICDCIVWFRSSPPKLWTQVLRVGRAVGRDVESGKEYSSLLDVLVQVCIVRFARQVVDVR